MKDMIMYLKPVLFIIIVLGALSSQASALDEVERAIIKCRTDASSPANQVVCLEKALRSMSVSEGDGNWAGSATPSVQSNSINAPLVKAPLTKAPLTKAPLATAPAKVAVIQPRGIGAEQVKAAQNKGLKSSARINVEAIVADFAYNQSNSLVLVLKNGQVWKQRAGDLNSVRLKKGETPRVIIRPGALSGYRMEFPIQKQTITVSRLQ